MGCEALEERLVAVALTDRRRHRLSPLGCARRTRNSGLWELGEQFDKSSKTENVRRGWTHVVGLVKTGLMVVIAQAAANLRCLRVWAARTGDRTDFLTRPDPEDYGFEEIDPAAAPPASTGRPAAA